MQTIKARVQVNLDHTVTVQVPDDMKVPADVQVGEYDAVLVLNSRSDSEVVQESSHADSEEQDRTMAVRWQKWFEEVEQLPLLENPEKGNFQQYLVEKYRKQGLIL
jgi:regulator of RNase E activity RraA